MAKRKFLFFLLGCIILFVFGFSLFVYLLNESQFKSLTPQFDIHESNPYLPKSPVNEPQSSDEEKPVLPSISSKEAKKTIEGLASELIQALKERDFAKIAMHTHPKQGVRFTPETLVYPTTDIVVPADELKDFLVDQRVYDWGIAGASDDTRILLKKADYYREYIYDKDFATTRNVGYNEWLKDSGYVENQYQVYPDAIIVEYYVPGKPDLDWAVLRLVFQKYTDDQWYLVGIIHSAWTP